MNTQININEAADLITAIGSTNTVILQGEPGIGKSALLRRVAKATGLEPRYIDCALLDLGDIQMPKVSSESVHFVPNALFTSPNDAPVVVMLDEIGKAMRPVQNALLTLLLEHRIGTHYLPPNSIVFGTTNLTTDGVGDQLQAHARNRVTFVTVSKPNVDVWLDWAINNDIDPAITTWVNEYPHCLASYTEDSDGAKENPYIYHPSLPRAAFVSPRSLAHASSITKQRHNMTERVLLAALAGTIGESAARDLTAFLQIGDSLPKWADVIAKPETTAVPDNVVACTILCHGAVQRLATSETIKDDANAWLTYLTRTPKEVQFLFVEVAKRNAKVFVELAKLKSFSAWVKENHWAY